MTHPLKYVTNTQQNVGILAPNVLDMIDVEFPTVDGFKAWCKIHRVTYYGKPRELFNEFDALQQAVANKSRYLILEDLS
jgi:hypothetical protein